MNIPTPVISSLIGLGGVVLGFSLQELRKRGKTKLEEANAQIWYDRVGDIRYISSFALYLQFINKSQHQRIIKILEVKYFDGLIIYKLPIDGFTLTPSGVVPAQAVKCLKFDVIVPKKQIVTPTPAQESDYMLVQYQIENKKRAIKINASIMEQLEGPTSLYGFHIGTTKEI
jgi:hypothetical protein